jgi:hypothetical protein
MDLACLYAACVPDPSARFFLHAIFIRPLNSSCDPQPSFVVSFIHHLSHPIISYTPHPSFLFSVVHQAFCLVYGSTFVVPRLSLLSIVSLFSCDMLYIFRTLKS